MILFSHKDDCKHGFKVAKLEQYDLCTFQRYRLHLGGHESGVHRLNGPQASMCEHHQQGGQQVSTFPIPKIALLSAFLLLLKAYIDVLVLLLLVYKVKIIAQHHHV